MAIVANPTAAPAKIIFQALGPVVPVVMVVIVFPLLCVGPTKAAGLS